IDCVAAARLGLGELLHLSGDTGDLLFIVECATLGCDHPDRQAHQVEASEDTVAIRCREVASPTVIGMIELKDFAIEGNDQVTTECIDSLGCCEDCEVVATDVSYEIVLVAVSGQ